MAYKKQENSYKKRNHNPRIFSYQYYKQLYDIEECHWWSKGIRNICEKMLKSTGRFNQTTRVIDIGCGTGISLTWLQNTNLAGSVVQTDISEFAIQFCKKRGHKRVLLSSASALPFRDNSFDLAISLDVIQHIDKKGLRESFTEAFRVLCPRGSFLIRTNVFRHGNNSGDSTTYRRFKMEELRALAEESGFTIERLSYANSVPAILSFLPILAIRKRIPGETSDNDQGLHLKLPEKTHLKDLIQYLFLKVEGLIVSQINIPLGHSMILLARKK